MLKKKNILIGYVTTFTGGGVNIYIKNVIKALNTENVSIDVLTNKYTDELKQAEKELGIHIIVIDRLTRPLKRYRETQKIVRNKKYDIIYFNISETFNSICNIAARKNSDAVIITHSHNSSNDAPVWWRRKLARFLNTVCRPIVQKNSDYYYACSEVAGEWIFGKKGVADKKKFRIIKNTVDVKKFSFSEENRSKIRKQYGIAKETLAVGFVGNLLYQKNPLFLVDIFTELNAIVREMQFFIIGEGELREQLTHRVEKNGIQEKVHFTGSVNNVYEYMSALDGFILPSFFEGLPIVGVEAQVNGLEAFFSDRITKEIRISNKAHFISLEESAKKWAELIAAQLQNIDRSHTEYLDVMYDMEKQKEEFKNIFLEDQFM